MKTLPFPNRFLRPLVEWCRLVPTLVLFGATSALAVPQDGSLRMEVITAYNFVVDSNVESPSSYSPSAAHLGVRVHNDGPTALTDVYISMGDLLDPGTGSGTPGVFPSRTVTVTGAKGYSGTFALQMPGGAVDAVRLIPRIEAGESVVQYFFVTYPLKDPAGNSVAGAAPDPGDDLWLNYDLWASANDGVATLRVDRTTKVTMRNEISAMANKIWPNTESKVPNQYLDAIEASLGWRPDTENPQLGSSVQMEGIWYDLGNVGAGFDNDGDGLPDRNAWLQPVGDPSLFDPLAARLVKCYGIVIVKLNDGTELLIPFEDRLYFENIPDNNTGAVGLVFYEFMPLAGGGAMTLSPYQEVASGYDNEKFNGDYGTQGGTITTGDTAVDLDKTGPALIAGGGVASYTMTATNNGSTGIGFPELSLPLTWEDSIPPGLVYVAGSATAANVLPPGQTLGVLWSTDGGVTWLDSEPAPASVTAIRWTLGGPLASGTAATVAFQAQVPVSYPSVIIDNTAILKLGPIGELDRDTVTTLLTGINSLGDLVWLDDDRDSVKDAGEGGIANVGVSLYFDANGDGLLDAGDIPYAVTETDGNGAYSFTDLPDGKFIAVVDADDADLPPGSSLADSIAAAITVDLDSAHVNALATVDLDVDWPFIGALEVVKTVTPSTYGAGELVTYTIDVENHAAPVAAKTMAEQTAWATTVTGTRVEQNTANAQGAPNNDFARLDWRANADTLVASGFTYPDPTGTITKVEMVFESYLATPVTDDEVEIEVNGSLFTTMTAAELNNLLGMSKEVAIDITSLNATWTWAQVQALTSNSVAAKQTASDASTLWVDATGFRVTTDAAPPATGTYGLSTLDPLPLTDTYDPAKLEFVSASVAPTSVIPGMITWDNVGPLNAGTRTSLTVTFRALSPPDTNGNGEPDTTTHLNTASSTGGKFVSGRPVNDASDTASITIEPRGRIGDLVFWDLNGNGAFDPGEPGIPGVIVNLSNGAQVRTDANGYYLFEGLPDGTYTVTVATASLPWTTFSQTVDPDGTVDNESTVTINNNDGDPANDFYLDRDFAYDSALNVISGTLFADDNGDGIRGASEAYFAGVTVTLLEDADSNGSYETTVTTATTNSFGFYSFGSLPDGLYQVVVTQPGATVQTLDPDLSPGNTSGDNATNENASGGNLYPDNDFAYQPSGTLTLGDTVYVDWNGDGVQDPGEDGIADVDVFLYEDANGNGVIDPAEDSLVAAAVTGADGTYGFTNLLAGDWIVVVNTADSEFPAGLLQTQDYDGTPDSRAVVDLVSSLDTVDFGYEPRGTGSIGDFVFVDGDGDGVMDPGEAGIANVTVTLYEDTDDNGVIDATDAVVATTSTGTSGSYLFSGLAPGNYLVDVDAASPAIPDDAYGNNYVGTTTDPHDVTLAADQIYLAADFGFAAPASVGDMVFFDANGNGTQDWNEEGIPGVTVELWADVDQDGQPDGTGPLVSTVTADGSGADPAGFYSFTNLSAGTYFVQVDTSTLPQSGGQPIPQTSDPDRDGVPVGDNTYPGLPPGDDGDSLVILSLGGNYLGADFGYQPPGAIGDFVWLDLDQDGVQDPGEPGISGVTVSITDGIDTYVATTDFDGYWSFSNLPDGDWTVSVPPSNFGTGAPLENTVAVYDADGGGDSSVAITVAGGDVDLPVGNLGLDFGYALNGSYGISGTVVIHDTGVLGTADDIDDFIDDGVDLDAGPDDEIELGGMTVHLYTTSGDFLGTTVTDPQGDYSFSGLPSGDYRVILGSTATPLDRATLTTTAANNPAVTSVDDSSGTSVIQTLTVGAASVSDVDFAFLSGVEYDYGDLPASYGMTTLAQDGARHEIPAGGSAIFLGSAPDSDTNGAADALAAGDDVSGSDDEDGITPVSPVNWTDGTVGAGAGGQIDASVTGTGWLVGWIDWNQDGDFLDPGELVADQAVSSGTTTIDFDIPAGTIDVDSQSWLSRFRLLASEPAYPLFSLTGAAVDGEVEDLLIEKPVGGSIGDIVWIDTNGNGTFETSESGVPGRIVELRDGTGALVATQTTSDGTQDVDGDGVIDPPGYYRFSGLATDTYSVTITNPPAGYTASYDEDGIGTPSVTVVPLAADEQHLTTDFGYQPMLASISGQVRYDADADGDLGDPDAGSPFVKVQLWTDPDGDGDPSDGTQVGELRTDTDGNYLFSGVPTGNYVVVEVNQAGSTSTGDVDGGDFDRIAVMLAGTDVTDRDFLDTTPPVYSISGSVFEDNDTSNDNVIGGDDSVLPMVEIKLFFDRDGDGVVSTGDPELASTFTSLSGFYQFDGLPPGDYVVQETDLPGAISDWDAQGALDDSQIAVTISTAAVTARDFLEDGLVAPGIITGTVWSDPDNNGTGDVGIPGVTLELRDSKGVLVGTTVTQPDGTYVFGNLPPGTYSITETQPDGYLSVSDADGGDPDVIGDVTMTTVTEGATTSGQDFLERPMACPNRWDDWVTKWTTALGGQTGPTLNPDGDLYSNLVEYAFCMPPDTGIMSPFCLDLSVSVEGAVDGVFRRTAGGALDVVYELQYISDLSLTPGGWTTIPLNPADLDITVNGDGTETVRIVDLETVTGLTGGAGFVRMKVSLDANGDLTPEAVDYTETGGWVDSALGLHCRTYNNPFLSCPPISGTIDGVAGQVLDLTTSANGTDLSSLLAPGAFYYLEVVSGTHEGHRFDIVSAGVDTMTLALDTDLCEEAAPHNTLAGALPATLAGDAFAVRMHRTLGDLFPTSLFTPHPSMVDSDKIQFLIDGTWFNYWLFDDGAEGRWVLAGDATLTDQGDLVVPPGRGMFINCRQTATTLGAVGMVRSNDFARPLCGDPDAVAGGHPVDESTVSRAMTLANGFYGSLDPKMANQFFFWQGDAVAGADTYDSYFLLDGGTAHPGYDFWALQGDTMLQNHNGDLLFVKDRSVLTDLHSVPLPGYIMPAPWTP